VTRGVFRQLAKRIWRMFSRLFRIVWKKRCKRRTAPHFPTTERYSSSLNVPTQATQEPNSTSERSPKINQTSTGNQNQNTGNVDNSTVLRDVHGNVYFGTYKRPTTGAPFQVPYLPQYFVERPEHHKEIKTRLLSLEGNRTGTLVVSAIYGLGGIGKSTLAAAVAHDPKVQAQFPDGVLWVTLGQQPDLLPLLSDWIQALGDHDYKPLTLDGASKHLRTLLHDKKALLVVDDAWNPEHVEPFRVGGSSCRVLVTTREATIRGASSYDLDVMTPNESLELLQKSQNNPLTKVEQQQAQQLAQTVGYLPLALDLAAAQVADGVSWQELLEDLNLEIARLESLQTPGADSCIHEEQRRHYSLIASFNLSLRSLTPEMLRQFAWFGVLPEDVVITHTMAATLWEINPRQALTTLRSFKTKALLLAGATGDDQKQTYRLHDLMHDAAKLLLTGDSSPNKAEELPGLGLSLTAAHSMLLDCYRSKTQQGLWHTLPDDGYIHANLSWHFEQASRTQELHQLLMEETAQGRNGWYETCDRLGQTGNFVTDIARAWRLAEKMFEENPSKSIALQCRYALITTSLNSLAKNIPASLMAALVKKGLWTPAQGLAYAQQAKESRQRAEGLSALAPHLSKPLFSIALDTARSIQSDYYRANALSGLAPHLPSELLQEALNTARSIQDDSTRAKALSGLAPHLPEILQEALDTARGIQDDFGRAIALSGLAPHLSSELLQEAFDTARSIQDDFGRAIALSGLAPHLSPELLQEALDAARSIPNDSNRAYALSVLAPHLPEILQEAFDAARSIPDDANHIALIGLALHLPKIVQEAVDVTGNIQYDSNRAYALIRLAPHMLPEILQKLLNTARSIQNGYYRAIALSVLTPHLPEILQEAFDTTRSIPDSYRSAIALSVLAPHLPPELLQEALDTARSIPDGYHRAIALSGLAPHLPSELLQEALDTARSIPDGYRSAIALSGLAPHLPSELLQEALDTARSIPNDSNRAIALSGLAPHLPSELLQEALNTARGIQDDSYRAYALSGLTPHLPEILQEALVIARSIQSDSNRAYALIWLAPHLPEILQEALDTARSIQDDSNHAIALSGLAPHLPPELLQEFLVIARSIQYDYHRAKALSGLAPHLPPELLQQALDTARSIQDDFGRAIALSGLAPYLPEILQEAFDTARSIQYDYSRAIALSGLAPHLPPELLQQALDTARSIQDDFGRAIALSGLAPYLPEILQEALDTARSIQGDRFRAYALSELARHLPEILQEALDTTRSIQGDSYRARALSELAPHLPPELLQQALDTTRSIPDDSERAGCFSSLLSVLNLASIKFDLWCEILHNLSHYERYKLLGDIPKLSDAIIPLGGTDALVATVRAIQQVCRQWR